MRVNKKMYKALEANKLVSGSAICQAPPCGKVLASKDFMC